MRIDARSPIATAAAAAQSRRASGSRFTLDEAGDSRAASAGTAASGVGGIEALLVLQADEDPGQRRRKTVQRGRDILDALDRLKVAILDGRIGATELLRIRQILTQRRETTDDPRLDDILAQIELRAEVELAKLARDQRR